MTDDTDEDELELINTATPIRFRYGYTVKDSKEFDEALKQLSDFDNDRIKEQGGRSRFKSHQVFIEHLLCSMMEPHRAKYFSIRTRNQADGKYTYRNVDYAIQLLEYCGWVNRVSEDIVHLATAGSEPQPRSRVEILNNFPVMKGDYTIANQDRDVDYVRIEHVTWNDSKGAYLDGTYTDTDKQKDNKLLSAFNQLMEETDIRDGEGNQLHWIYPLERRINKKDYLLRKKRVQGITNTRFWGHKLLNKNEDDRLSHTFNGETLVEVDIVRCFTQFAFHINEIPVPDLRNFYDIPQKIIDDPEVKKDKIKGIFNRAYFVSNEQRWKDSLMLDHCIKPEQADLLLPRYGPIRNTIFNKSIGHQLMWMESQIVRYVLNQAVKDQVPVIPIHDSYLVPQDKESWIKSCINVSYHSQFREPFVTKKESIGDMEYFHYQVQTTSTFPS